MRAIGVVLQPAIDTDAQVLVPMGVKYDSDFGIKIGYLRLEMDAPSVSNWAIGTNAVSCIVSVTGDVSGQSAYWSQSFSQHMIDFGGVLTFVRSAQKIEVDHEWVLPDAFPTTVDQNFILKIETIGTGHINSALCIIEYTRVPLTEIELINIKAGG